MDRTKAKSKTPNLLRLTLVPIVGLALAGGVYTLANTDFKTHRVNRNKMSIETVRQGTMEVKVSANGVLLSKNVEQIVAQVPGRVARKIVKPGTMVEKGQVLVELTNPDLASNLEQAELAWEGVQPQLQSSKATMEINILNQEGVVAQAQLALEKARLRAKTNRSLYASGEVALVQLRNSELEDDETEKAYAIQTDQLKQLRGNIDDQIAVQRFHGTQLARALDRTRTQADELKIAAGIGGIVQSIDVEVGQQLQPGTLVGSIAQQDNLYAELKVPAREASQVAPGQSVVVDTRNGLIEGAVSRVAPGVTDGTVVMDVELHGSLPAGARPQLQVEGTIYINRIANAVFVGKPSYVKNNAEVAVYKLDPTGHYATRVRVMAGKISLNDMQVLSGLKPGDRIVTSEIGEFQGEERVLLN